MSNCLPCLLFIWPAYGRIGTYIDWWIPHLRHKHMFKLKNDKHCNVEHHTSFSLKNVFPNKFQLTWKCLFLASKSEQFWITFDNHSIFVINNANSCFKFIKIACNCFLNFYLPFSFSWKVFIFCSKEKEKKMRSWFLESEPFFQNCNFHNNCWCSILSDNFLNNVACNALL